MRDKKHATYKISVENLFDTISLVRSRRHEDDIKEGLKARDCKNQAKGLTNYVVCAGVLLDLYI
jgi:hypothetical protein